MTYYHRKIIITTQVIIFLEDDFMNRIVVDGKKLLEKIQHTDSDIKQGTE